MVNNLSPNDSFHWREENKPVVPEGHALRTLKRNKDAPSATELLRDIPADKLEKLGEMLAELKRGDKTNQFS